LVAICIIPSGSRLVGQGCTLRSIFLRDGDSPSNGLLTWST